VKKFKCTVCDYMYDPGDGAPQSDISPNTPFEEIHEDWRCPVCGVGKKQFEELVTENKNKEEVTRQYSRPRLTIIWKSGLCNHNGNCIRTLPEVFDLKRRPWVDVTGADIDTIMKVIDECPTGALSYRTEEDR